MRFAFTAAFVAASSLFVSFAASAQSSDAAPTLVPRYVVLPPHVVPGVRFPESSTAASLVQWNGSYTDLLGHTINYTMAGMNPSSSNATTTIKALIIPIKMVYGATNGNMTFDPMVDTVPGGKTVIQNIVASPLFNASVDYVQGGTDLGTAQYIDAYQRGNFWSSVSTNTGYHTVLQVTVLPEKTIKVKPSQGQVVSNYFTPGFRGLMDINAFDAKLQGFMAAIKKVNPGVLPIFITDNVFLTSGGGCCIGGYHSANASQPGGQTYSHASYINSAGSFAQDVSALSHELGEWMDDPFVDNSVGCTDNSIMENGDPIEGHANYGGFPYTVGGFTYNLQSLVFIPYFGAPTSTSVNHWYSFQNDIGTFCPGQ